MLFPGAYRRALWLGASVLAISAGLAAGARAQTVVGPGQTVTNSGSNTGGYALTGSGGTLINSGTIATSGTVSVSAEVEPFSPGDLTTYRILGIALNNSGLISATSANALTGISVNGFTWSNGGTLTSSDIAQSGLPTVYLNNVNNLQLTNNGTVQLTGGFTASRLLTALKLTNSTITNTGLMASQVNRLDTSALIFVSGDSNNVTVNNSGTIASSSLNQAILIGNDGTAAVTTTIDGTHIFALNPSATNVTINNSGFIGSGDRAIVAGGTSSGVTINNNGSVVVGAIGSHPAIAVQDAASNVAIANSGLISNLAGGPAISVSSSGTGLSITNGGTIAAPGFAIDHAAGTTPLAISNSGIINGGIRLSQPGDTVNITGGAISGAITTVNGGAGSVVFNAAGGFSTGGDLGSAGAPLGGITVAGGALNVGNALIANVVTFGGGTATLTGNVSAVAGGGTLNFAGGSVNLGTNTMTLGANATIRTSTAGGSSLALTISPTQNGLINARAGNATVDTSANTLFIRPSLAGGAFPKPGSEYAVIATSAGANVNNALTRISVTPGPFTVGMATTATDAYGNPLTIGKDVVLITTASAGSEGNAAIAPSNTQIERAQTNAIVASVSNHLDNILGSTIGVQPGGGASGGDEEGPGWSIWQDTSAMDLENGALGSSYRGWIYTGLLGADRPVGDKFIVGAVLGGEGNSFDLMSSGSKRSGTGVSITPYAAYIINDWSSVDLEASYAALDNNVTVPQGNASVTNHYMSNRVFVAGNASAYTNIDAFTLRAKFGMLWADNSGPEYRDANGNLAKPPNVALTQAKLGGEVTYHYEQFEPFVNLTTAQDLTGSGTLNTPFGPAATHGSAKFGLQYDAGLRYKTEGGSSFGLQVGGETLRAHQSSFIAGVFARIPL
jgi:hypothetical protein